jgi:hypothetical protein
MKSNAVVSEREATNPAHIDVQVQATTMQQSGWFGEATFAGRDDIAV